MSPEIPYLLAGTTAVVGGYTKEKKWPNNGTTAVLATVALAFVASVADGTRLGPLVGKIGWLLFAAAVYAYGLEIAKVRKK